MSAAASVATSAADPRLAALELACQSIAPAWPLDRQIAVSPYWGLRTRPFAEAAARLRKLTGAPMAAEPQHYRAAWESGAIKPSHLSQAARAYGEAVSMDAAISALAEPTRACRGLPLLSDFIDADARHPEGAAWPARVTQQLSQYCASYFDHGYAQWHADPGNCDFFSHWRSSLIATHGPFPRERALKMPAESRAALDWALDRLAIRDRDIRDLLQVVALRINGWAAWCAYLSWEAALAAREDPHLGELIIMRLCCEALLHDGRQDPASAWSQWMERWNLAQRSEDRKALMIALIWQRAEEISYQERLCAELLTPRSSAPAPHSSRPPAQLVFCIDVRSERLRRAIETIDAQMQTHGFAGFFGLPIRYSPLGTALERQQLPGLIAPSLTAQESTGNPARDRALAGKRAEALAWRASTTLFERLPSGSFTAVEMFGLTYLPKLLLQTLAHPSGSELPGLSRNEREQLRPCLPAAAPEDIERHAGMVAGILRAMNLSSNFARLLVLVGHGAQTTNNPQAAGLACGACGGHSGAVNARLLAGLLNDGSMRRKLAQLGIVIPPDTVALAALHDTVTDTVEIFDVADVPDSHTPDLNRLLDLLAQAGRRVRAERAHSLGLAHLCGRDTALLRQLRRRARDWSETRPEWGLVDNAALIVAQRTRTHGIDLRGRVFLHEYCWEHDHDASILEQILSAPMIVAHWINMQYYGSTVDPQRFGSGNKVLHNVVGGHIGVLEGYTGDLRIGLARQSVHDGERWLHTPLRLSVVVDAPAASIETVLDRQQTVRELIENQWVHLLRFAEQSIERYESGHWVSAHPHAAPGPYASATQAAAWASDTGTGGRGPLHQDTHVPC